MNLNTNSINKNNKRKIILEYVKTIYHQENRFVSKREIRKMFHVELYNYFTNIFELYQQLGIDVPLCFCPKDYARRKIVKYVQEKANCKIYPTKKEIEADLKIHIYSYYKNAKYLYDDASIDYKLYKKRVYQLEARFNTNAENIENMNNILCLIKEHVVIGIYPSVPFIQEKLGLSFYKYFNNIYGAYAKAKVNYNRPCPIILGRKKEKVLTRIALHLLVEMGFTIKRISIFDKNSYNKGEDILAVDSTGKEWLIELKAYGGNKRVSKREIVQLVDYMGGKHGSKGVLITTSYVVSKTEQEVIIVDGNELIKLIKNYKLGHFLEEIKWIQSAKVNKKELIEAKNRKRQTIIKFIINNPHFSLPGEIEKELRLNLRTYFGERSIKLIKKIRNDFSIYNNLPCMDLQ